MTDQKRPTHWFGVDSKEHWPETGCPIDWQWLESLGIADGGEIYAFAMEMVQSVYKMAEENRPAGWERYVSYLACHGLAAMNYMGGDLGTTWDEGEA